MKIALFGGTFNPIHIGHLLLAEAARAQFQLERVLFIPAGCPPHKTPPLASASHRLTLIRLAIRGNPHFEVSDWEVRQKRPVYTTETLDHFLHDHRHEWFFLMGSDSLSRIRSWRCGVDLLDRCTFLIAERPENPWDALPISLRRKTRLIQSSPAAIASQDLRRQIRQGGSIRYQVPEAVERYIRRHRLYRKEDRS